MVDKRGTSERRNKEKKTKINPKEEKANTNEEEGSRIGLNLRAIETGGLSIGKQLVRPDLKAGEPCGRPGCVLDRCSGGAGGPHNVPSVVYRGTCKLCGLVEVTSEYWGESAFSGGYRVIGQNNMRMMWRKERSPMLSASILRSFILRARATSSTSRSKFNLCTKSL